MKQEIVNKIMVPPFKTVTIVKEFSLPNSTKIRYARKFDNLTMYIPSKFHNCSDEVAKIACKGILDKIFDTDLMSYDEAEYIEKWARGIK